MTSVFVCIHPETDWLAKDKTQFRQYEEACDRVKLFYKEQHGA